METILLVGVGDVGKHILEFASREDSRFEWIVGDIDEDRARWACNNAEIGATHHGKHPKFRPKKIDLFNIEKTTELIQIERPIAVINCAVLHTWHLIRQLPEDLYIKISSAGLGAWLPCQLILGMNLAQAIKSSGLSPYYINSSLSCLTNPVMGKVGLAPTIGIGNVDLIAPAIATHITQKTGVLRYNIEIYLVCHHQHWVYPREAGYRSGAPYFLKIMINGHDVTKRFNTDQLMYEAVKLYPPGIAFTTVSASSALKNLNAMVLDQGLRTHSPGPSGLPGGYPVRLSAKGAEVVLPPEISLEEAIKMNEESGRLDSIEKIKDDGTVIFADYTYKIMKETLGFDCKSFKLSDTKKLAFEQLARYKELLVKQTN
jgi:hypothetical protein|tara:strand:+ start:3229 stop:4347 length:1119 start_codon:yes stop_codon:yes gene_type:complete